MNIASTGAANIRHAAANIGDARLWQANQDVMFSWDAQHWNIINPMTRGVMMQPSTALPGTPTIETRPTAASNGTQIPDTFWVRARIAEALGGGGIIFNSAEAFETGTWFPDLMGTNAHFEVAKYQMSGQKVTASFQATCFGIGDEIALDLWDLPIFPQSPITSTVYISDGEQTYTAQFITQPYKPNTAMLYFNDTPNSNSNFTMVAEINYFI